MSANNMNSTGSGSTEDVQKRYFLPRNLEEAKRMQNQHEWIKGCAGRLILAPVESSSSTFRVLDSATADGYWIQDAVAECPNGTEFIGFDNAPEGYPPLEGSNIHVVKQNLVDKFPSEWKDGFDLVHQRFVIPLFKEEEVPNVLDNLIGCIKPGGWIQLVEMDFTTYVSHPPEKTTAVQAVHKLTSQIVSDPKAATKLAGRLEKQGLINVDYKAIDMVAGNAHENPEIGERGYQNMLTVLNYFQSVAKPEMLGMSEEEWTKLPEDFAKEMKESRVALRVYFVWGQKPKN